MALRALDELAAAVEAGAVLASTRQLRFLLAFLCDAAPCADRAPFDRAWRAATRPGPADERAATLRAAHRAILTAITAADPGLAVASAIRRQDDDGRQQKAWERRGKHCPIQRPMLDRWPPGTW